MGSGRRRSLGKLRFAAPFVVVTAPLLTDCARRDCTKVVEGTSCSGAERCAIDGKENDCGLNGYSCHEGKWRADMTYCNPPPQNPPMPEPTPQPPPGAPASAGPSSPVKAVGP